MSLHIQKTVKIMETSKLCRMMLIGFGLLMGAFRAPLDTAAFSLRESLPSKVFTPNGDGINDTFRLVFDNPAGNILTQKKILDIHGREIADFEAIGPENGLTVVLAWNGKDESGEWVRSGVYVYQVQAENRVINGTVVVAR